MYLSPNLSVSPALSSSVERFKEKRNQFLSGSTSATGMSFLVVIIAGCSHGGNERRELSYRSWRCPDELWLLLRYAKNLSLFLFYYIFPYLYLKNIFVKSRMQINSKETLDRYFVLYINKKYICITSNINKKKLLHAENI